MSDAAFEQTPPLITSVDEMTEPAKRKWLVGVWAISTVVVTTGWWSGLAFTALWFVRYALS